MWKKRLGQPNKRLSMIAKPTAKQSGRQAVARYDQIKANSSTPSAVVTTMKESENLLMTQRHYRRCYCVRDCASMMLLCDALQLYEHSSYIVVGKLWYKQKNFLPSTHWVVVWIALKSTSYASANFPRHQKWLHMRQAAGSQAQLDEWAYGLPT